MPISIEKQTFNGINEVYDLLKQRQLWPVTAAHRQIEEESPHWHTQHNVIFIVEGEAQFYDGDKDVRHEISAGDIVTIPARTLHAIRADDPVVFVAAFDHAFPMKDFIPHPPEEL